MTTMDDPNDSGSTDADAWQARWIGPAGGIDVDRRNSWYCFRKTLAVGDPPDELPVRIACDSKYWLWVNGELVVLEGGLKRGPTPTGTYFDRVDVAPFLRPGENTIAVLLWHFGRHGFSHNDSGKVGLIVDGSGDGLSLRTDSTWRARRHPAFENAGDPEPNFRLPEGSIRFDARKELTDWQTTASVEEWPQAVERGQPPDAPWGELVERPIPQWRDYGVGEYTSVTESAEMKQGLLRSGTVPSS